MESDVGRLVDDFASNPVVCGRALRQLLEQDAKQFLASSRWLLQCAPDKPGFYYLLALLQSHDLVLKTVCDPSHFTTQESIALAKRLSRVDPHLDVKLAKVLLAPGVHVTRSEVEQNARTPAGRRLLEIITAISDGSRSLLIAQLLEHPDLRVRSKAALLVGKSNKNARWVKQRLQDQDGRVRANALEALWGVKSDDCRAVFWSALADPDNRVAGNALVGLYRLGDPATIGLILKMSSRPELDFQTTAVWVMGESGDVRFLPALAKMEAASPALRTHLFQATMKLKQRRARLLARPALVIDILSESPWRDGRKEISLSVRSASETSLAGLLATEFGLSIGADLITEYDVRETVATRSLWVGFAIPEQCERAYSAFAHLKRRGDRWVVRFPVTGELYLEAKTLLTAAAMAQGRKHLILVDDGSCDPTPSEVEKIVSRAQAASVALHGIGIGSNGLRQLCLRSGGTFMRGTDDSQLPQLLERSYAHFVSGYHLRLRVPAGVDSSGRELKITVCAEHGLGEAVLG